LRIVEGYVFYPSTEGKVENGRVKSHPDTPRFLHLTHPFPFSGKIRVRDGSQDGNSRERGGNGKGSIPFGLPGSRILSGWTRTLPGFSAHRGMAPPHHPFSPSVHHNSQKPCRSPVNNPTTHRTKHYCAPFALEFPLARRHSTTPRRDTRRPQILPTPMRAHDELATPSDPHSPTLPSVVASPTHLHLGTQPPDEVTSAQHPWPLPSAVVEDDALWSSNLRRRMSFQLQLLVA
jgi:hypothetical protein